jgi:hypothetical protein
MVCDTLHYGHAPTYQISLTYLERNNYLTLRSEVKVPRRSLWYATPPYGHAPTYQLSLTYLERQKCYGPDKKILFKKQLFYLEVKGQGPTKVIMVRDTALWSCTHIRNIIDLSRYLTLKSKVKVQRRSLRCATHRLMVMHPYTKYH